MENFGECCCIQVKTLATMLSVFGLVVTSLSILLCLASVWIITLAALIYLPIGISLMGAFVLVLEGLKKSNWKYLAPANAIFAINFIIDGLLTERAINMGSHVPQALKDAYNKSHYHTDFPDTEWKTASLVVASLCAIAAAYHFIILITVLRIMYLLLKNPQRASTLPTTLNEASANSLPEESAPGKKFSSSPSITNPTPKVHLKEETTERTNFGKN